jgi:flagellar motor protein MotB
MIRNLAADDERSTADSAPAWMVSYGDMMSLLLTLFVMLVSMSEIKQNDRFQGVADSLHEQFSLNLPAGDRDGEVRPRNAALAVLAVSGRQARQKVMSEAASRNDMAAVPQPVAVDTTAPVATPEKPMVRVSLRDDESPADPLPPASIPEAQSPSPSP